MSVDYGHCLFHSHFFNIKMGALCVLLDLATGVSQSRVREFGTVYPPNCGSLALNFDTLNRRLLKAFLFGETTAH